MCSQVKYDPIAKKDINEGTLGIWWNVKFNDRESHLKIPDFFIDYLFYEVKWNT